MFAKLQLFAHVFLYMLPYYMSLLINDWASQFVCIAIAIVTTSIFLFNELIQMRAFKQEYFKEKLNVFELLHFSLFFAVASMRLEYLGHTLLPPTISVSFHVKLLNSLCSLTSFIKLFSFFRANQTFAKMVILITSVLRDILPFTVIYILVILQYSIMYGLHDIKLYDNFDFPNMEDIPGWFKQFISGFRTSLGDT